METNSTDAGQSDTSAEGTPEGTREVFIRPGDQVESGATVLFAGRTHAGDQVAVAKREGDTSSFEVWTVDPATGECTDGMKTPGGVYGAIEAWNQRIEEGGGLLR
jgi:hypothetical protein